MDLKKKSKIVRGSELPFTYPDEDKTYNKHGLGFFADDQNQTLQVGDFKSHDLKKNYNPIGKARKSWSERLENEKMNSPLKASASNYLSSKDYQMSNFQPPPLLMNTSMYGN